MPASCGTTSCKSNQHGKCLAIKSPYTCRDYIDAGRHHCPGCGLEYASDESLSLHYNNSGACQTKASLRRSMKLVGAATCPRCRHAMSSGDVCGWTPDGFAHIECLTQNEHVRLGIVIMPEEE